MLAAKCCCFQGRHALFYTESPCFRRCRANHPATAQLPDNDWLADQVGTRQQFHRGKERIHVEYEDDTELEFAGR